MIFMEDKSAVYVRAGEFTKTLDIDLEIFDKLSSDFPLFGKRIQMFQNRLLMNLTHIPLDILFYLPPKALRLVRPGYMERRNILKNIVFQQVLQVRKEKSKPKLQDILKVFQNT